MKCEVNYFISSKGDIPVQDFLNQNTKLKAKAIRILSQVQIYGLVSVIPHIKKLQGTPLWEIRILGKDSARILYITQTQEKILLLHGFLKKTQKTPPKEINIALNRLREYQS